MIFYVLAVILCPWVHCINISDYPPPLQVPSGNPNWTFAILYQQKNPDFNTWEYYQCPQPLTWGISYDDGPSEYTQLALDALDQYSLKSTFFVVGSHLLQNPEMLIKTYQRGHQIGIHTWSHSDLTKLSNDQVVAELVWTMKLIKDIIGVTPTYFRPPYGSMNANVRYITAALGLKTIQWNRDSKDWHFTNYYPGKIMEPPFNPYDGPDAIINQFKSWVYDQRSYEGCISLQHDYSNETASQIEASLNVLSNSPYKITNIQGCLGFPSYDERIWDIIRKF